MSNQDTGPRNWVSHIEVLLFDPRDQEAEANFPISHVPRILLLNGLIDSLALLQRAHQGLVQHLRPSKPRFQPTRRTAPLAEPVTTPDGTGLPPAPVIRLLQLLGNVSRPLSLPPCTTRIAIDRVSGGSEVAYFHTLIRHVLRVGSLSIAPFAPPQFRIFNASSVRYRDT